MGHPNLIRGIIADDYVSQEYATTLAEVAQGHYQGAHFKQLIGHPGKYSLRSNRKKRLYGIFYRNYLIIIDEDLQHKLGRHHTFLNLNIEDYLTTHAATFDTLIENKQFITCEKPNQNNLDFFQNRPLDSDYCPPTFYNNQWITPSREQQYVLKAPLPLGVGGGAGAGKSLIALWILKQLAVNPGRYFYITEEEGLASYIGECGDGMDLDLSRGIISFVSYKQFLITVCNLLPEQLVDNEHLQTWLISYVTRYKFILKNTQQPSIFDYDIETKIPRIIDEFLIRSRYSLEEYQTVAGDRRSFFMSDPKKRNWLNTAYQAYEKALSSPEIELIHTSFYKIPDGIEIDGAVYDEVQNATLLKIENVRKCAKNQVAFLFDSNQATKRAYPIRMELKKCLGKKPIELEYTFRCPAQVTELAERVTQLKNELSSGKLDKEEPHTLLTLQQKVGFVRWVDQFNEIQEQLAMYRGTLQMAVVVMDKCDLHHAKQLFPECELVFTGEEIQGREYPIIVVLYPLDGTRMTEANKLLKTIQAKNSSKTIINRAKNDSGNTEFITMLNTLFTIITRSLEGVFVIQPYTHHNNLLYNTLNPELSRVNDILPASLPKPVMASADDLEQEAQKLEILGQKKQAETLRASAQAKKQTSMLPQVENLPQKIRNLPQPREKQVIAQLPVTKQSHFELVKQEMNKQNIEAYIKENNKLQVTLFQKGDNKKSLYIQMMLNRESEQHFLKALEIFLPFQGKTNEAKGFINQLCNIDEFTGMPNLFWLVKTLAGQIVLMNILRSNNDLISLMKDGIFHLQLQKNSFDWEESAFAEHVGKSIFYMFAQFDSDLFSYYKRRALILRRKITLPVSFLDNLICLKKLQNLTIQSLLTSCQYNGNYFSAMHFFSEDATSRLAFLFKYNHFAKKINAACLFTQIEKQPPGASLFFYLTLQPVHYPILIDLFKKPEIKKACSMQNLLKANGSGGPVGLSPFFSLSRTKEGCDILASVIPYDDTFITSKILYAPLPQLFGRIFGQSIFNNLCRTDEGCKILSNFYIKQPNFLNEIPLETLTYSPEGNREQSNEFPLFLLARNRYGNRIIQHLVIANPEVAKKITLSVLSQRVSVTKDGPEQRTLALLLGSQIGRECFIEILDANKELETEPFGNIICEIHDSVRSKDWEFPHLINGSMFYLLTDWAASGLAILRKLINPNFLQFVNSRLLNTRVGPIKSQTTPLFNLAASNEGCALLLDILKNNNDLIDATLIQTLFDCNLLDADNVKVSTLYLMAMNEKGGEVIDYILGNYSDFLPNIITLLTPHAALPSIFTLGSIDNTGLSMFRLLLRTVSGRSAVLKLLTNPYYANEISSSKDTMLDTYVQDLNDYTKEDRNAKAILRIVKPKPIKSFSFYQPVAEGSVEPDSPFNPAFIS